MKLRFKDKTKHPMFGQKHSAFAKSQISKPGSLNPMFNKNHSIETRKKISINMSKRPVALYSLDNQLIKKFFNLTELADYLNLHKTTVGRYLKSGKVILNNYYIREVKT